MARRNAPKKMPKRAEGRVGALTARGEAVVETGDGGVVHAPFGLVGERVQVVRDRRVRGVWHGRIQQVLEAAPGRVDPPCPIHARCGGCPLMALGPALQRDHKRDRVARAVGPGGAPEGGVEWVGAGPSLGYRRRARMRFGPAGHGMQLGYQRFRSHALVDVERCVVLAPALDRALHAVRTRWLPALAGRGELRFGVGRDGLAVVALTSDAPQPPAAYDAARVLVGEGVLAGAALTAGGATVPATFGDPAEHAPGWDGEPLVGPLGGFSQANDAVNQALVERVHRWAAPAGARVLELYAGVGNLTVALASDAAEVVAVEQDPASAEACRANLARRGLGATVRSETAEVGASGPPVDAVVLDPPREGAAGAVDGILARHPARIVYVSCEPRTLGRDLQRFSRAGYAVSRAAALDMFPQTAHVEAAVLLQAANLAPAHPER